MRVLVVEDDQKLAAVLRQGLKEQGYSVDLAAAAAQGFDMALASDYDAILLDVMLPGRSGFDVLRDLRARGSRSPILVLSALVGAGSRTRPRSGRRRLSEQAFRVSGTTRAAASHHETTCG